MPRTERAAGVALILGAWMLGIGPAAAAPVAQPVPPTGEDGPDTFGGLVHLNNGCVGSIVSASGLILTTANCVAPCLRQLDNEANPVLRDGHAARSHEEELRCPYLPAWRSLPLNPDSAAACAESGCTPTRETLTDLRLVWATESALRNFGEHLEAGSTPRHAVDVALLRWWQDEQPAQTGAVAHTLDRAEMASGTPLRLPRLHDSQPRPRTAAELAFERDHALPARYEYALHTRYSLPPDDPLHRRARQEATELHQRLAALRDGALVAELLAADASLREEINDRGKWRRAWGHIHPRLEQINREKATLVWPALLLGGDDFWSERYRYARLLLSGQQDPTRPELYFTQQLYRQGTQRPETETLRFAKALEYLRDRLGFRHPATRKLLGNRAPTQVAHELLGGTSLQDIHQRRQLWEGGKSALDASTDPLLGFARVVMSLARELRDQQQALEAEERLLLGELQQARLEILDDGRGIEPGSYLPVQAQPAPATVGSLYMQAGPFRPFALPARWWEAENRMSTTTALNSALSGDAGYGYRGAPVLNGDAGILGLVIEPTDNAARKQYRREPQQAGVIALHSAAWMKVLVEVYGLEWLLNELLAVD